MLSRGDVLVDPEEIVRVVFGFEIVTENPCKGLVKERSEAAAQFLHKVV
jgi:hypothetical protein